jgi:hypothetical protein
VDKNPPAPKKAVTVIPKGLWRTVVAEWLTEETGLPVIGSGSRWPPGTCDIELPPNASLSAHEIIDILNDQLASTNRLFLLRQKSIIMWFSDERLPRDVVPKVELENLNKQPARQIVEIWVPLKSSKAASLAATVTKMVSGFGDVIPLEDANRLILIDTAENLRRILAVLKEIDRDKS